MNLRKFNPSKRAYSARQIDLQIKIVFYFLFFLFLANVQILYRIGKFISSIRSCPSCNLMQLYLNGQEEILGRCMEFASLSKVPLTFSNLLFHV